MNETTIYEEPTMNETTIYEEPIEESNIILEKTENIEIPPSIYFGGCSNGGVFYIGVYQAMIDKWGADFSQKTVIYGDSASIIIVIAITRQMSPERVGEIYKEFGKHIPFGMMSGCFPLEEYLLKKTIDDLKDPLLHEKLNNRMYIGLSSFFAKHIWICEWDSIKDLYKCMVDAVNIPFFCNSKNKSKNKYLDGAFIFSGKDLPHGDSTLYVADDPSADIKATFTMKEMFYSNLDDDYDRLYKNGYDAFMNWDGKYKEKIHTRKSKYGIQCLLWVLCIIENICDIFNYFYHFIVK